MQTSTDNQWSISYVKAYLDHMTDLDEGNTEGNGQGKGLRDTYYRCVEMNIDTVDGFIRMWRGKEHFTNGDSNWMGQLFRFIARQFGFVYLPTKQDLGYEEIKVKTKSLEVDIDQVWSAIEQLEPSDALLGALSAIGAKCCQQRFAGLNAGVVSFGTDRQSIQLSDAEVGHFHKAALYEDSGPWSEHRNKYDSTESKTMNSHRVTTYWHTSVKDQVLGLTLEDIRGVFAVSNLLRMDQGAPAQEWVADRLGIQRNSLQGNIKRWLQNGRISQETFDRIS